MSSGPPVRVAVVGGGIIGVSTALNAVKNLPGLVVTNIADKWTPFTTGDGAAGFWNPYQLGDVDDETMRYWLIQTFNFLRDIARSPDAAECGVGFLSSYELQTKFTEDPMHSDIFLNWRDMTETELSMFPERFKFGKFSTTVFAECSRLLPVLMKKFKLKGGRVVRRKIQSFSELAGEFDVIINCTGVHSFHLVPDDKVYPIRGQVIRVSAPWIKHAVISDKFHILPNSELIVCGGTLQKGDWNLKPDPEDRKRIWEGCCELLPSLKYAKLVKEWVGLRPGRYKPRLERGIPVKNEYGQIAQMIHNYGHGGSGVTLFWGCAKQTVALLDQVVAEIKLGKTQSNL